jgi:LacI family transcriptional regulator
MSERKKTTITDIARELDVTPSTVSRALNNHPRISDSTKKAVWNLVKKLNYQPNNIATALRNGKSNFIGVIVPTSDRYFFASVIRGIEEVVREEGYNLIICQSDEQTNKEQKNIDALLQIQVDGIIASVAKATTEFSYFEKIINQNVPLVLYDRAGENLNVNSVVCDDYRGAYNAVSHLIDQGCTDIAHFAGQQHIKIYKDRLNGYLDALKDHGLGINERFIIESDLINDTDIILAAGAKMTNNLLSLSETPDAIFSASDFAALGAIKALKSNGISIPDDVALIGFSNDFSSSVIEPGLTSLDQHTKKMGMNAGKLFLEQIKDPKKITNPKSIVLEPKLVVRESSSIKKSTTSEVY